MNPDDMPRLPKRNLQPPDRYVKEMKPGERAVLIKASAVRVDEDLRVWIDGKAALLDGGNVPGFTVQVERTESGFILWLDKTTTFKPEKLSLSERWIPVVEFRDGDLEIAL